MIHNNLELLNHSRELMIEIHKLTLILASMPIFGETRYFTRPMSPATPAGEPKLRKKHYNLEFIKYLVSNQDITQNSHDLETLFQKGKLTPENFYAALKGKFDRLCNIINGLKQSDENESLISLPGKEEN